MTEKHVSVHFMCILGICGNLFPTFRKKPNIQGSLLP